MPHSTGRGPISMKASMPLRLAMPAAKPTGARMWRTQYPGVAGSPAELATRGMAADPKSTLAAALAKSPRIGSISGEWKACDTCNGTAWAPAAATTAATSRAAPATTTLRGPL